MNDPQDARGSHRIKWLAGLGGMLVLLVVLTELLGVALCFIQTGRLVYRAPPSVEAALAPPLDFGQRLHPYFGFTGPYAGDTNGLRTNGLGFPQSGNLPVPYPAAPRDFIVALFGGSVAMHVAVGTHGAAPLGEVLQALPALAGRNVVVIDMAQGSGKQPQQLIELAYLLAAGQHIDCVINLDGFNEFALGYQNFRSGVHPILPSVQIVRPIAMTLTAGAASADYFEAAARLLSVRKALEADESWRSHARTGAGYFTASIFLAWDRWWLNRSTEKYEDYIFRARDWSDLKAQLGLDLPLPQTDIFDSIFQIWLRASQQMKALAQANGALYLHVIQPNQYYSKHVFTEHEKTTIGLPADHEYRIGVGGGYRLLEERRALLDSNGIVSAIDLFDSEPNEVYFDPCCHYNGNGMRMFDRFVAEQVAKRIAAHR
jgi:hypothetical protein